MTPKVGLDCPQRAPPDGRARLSAARRHLSEFVVSTRLPSVRASSYSPPGDRFETKHKLDDHKFRGGTATFARFRHNPLADCGRCRRPRYRHGTAGPGKALPQLLVSPLLLRAAARLLTTRRRGSD